MTINTDLLARTYRDIEANPDGWNQSQFQTCFAARLCKLAGVDVSKSAEIRDAAMALMGITDAQAHALFYATPTDLATLWDFLDGLFDEHDVPINDPGRIILYEGADT